MLLNKQLREGIWETQLVKIQEYDMEIKPLKVIKGQGLCKMMFGIEVVNIIPPHIDDTTMQYISLPRSEWYKDIVLYMKSKHFPIELSYKEIRDLKMNTNQYVLVSGILFQRNMYGFLLRFMYHSKSQQTLQEFHKWFCIGNFAPTMTTP
jgi:hypothetical protein